MRRIIYAALISSASMSAHDNLCTASVASFRGLGDLPGGNFSSRANAVSADGKVVVGRGDQGNLQAFRWTESTGIVGLGYLPAAVNSSTATAVSTDGSIVVGSSLSFNGGSGTEAFRWVDTNGNGQVDIDEELNLHPEFGLGSIAGGGVASEATGVSSDGTVVVGLSPAFHWSAEDGSVGLGDLPGAGSISQAFAVSADGQVTVGFASTMNTDQSSVVGQEAFRWVDPNHNGHVDPGEELDHHPEYGLGVLPGGIYYSHAKAVSADGAVVVGDSASSNTDGYFGSVPKTEAFRWTESTGMVGLGDLPGGIFASRANAVSSDGTVVVGVGTTSTQLNQGQQAFIWDQVNGMRYLGDVLASEGGIDLAGWVLTEATGISADGVTIVGYGTNPDGYTEAWIAVLGEPIPPPIRGDLDGDAYVGIADLNIILTNWNQFVPPGDLRGDVGGVGGTGPDGYIGIDDLNVVLGNWNMGTQPVLVDVLIPEPSSILLLVVGGAWLARR